ncbi:winged helix-turn-helix domain-containing protein [Bradyrhizobium viridifuturi]|nr:MULTISPECIES: winged helix-turn-helix domain-containing protein [Bradyrhizobium]ERF80094.1 MAG: hypothetical protein C207_06675 [Bradyrhizobium sp. DFCI-1]OYU58264.1 MAG: transcriptional regulator CadC [Bradyrhizobium sp. PARBB1]PSO23828.1 tetratricopeptide repeat protein [Bradyrhizobium sp. MOS004]QRI68146.1 winged helix-turn-helix domain-containing protein [Bradyrhizobium sp. PSBB068]MBR1023090.1 winged helix-turn-helix domain-containing protein [Bradyrhizobium viridifuturi]
MLRFAGFEIDRQRSELRGPGGQTIKLRLKAFALLSLLAANPRRIIGKQELMEAVWPGVHVSDDSLFQTIRELRAALGDDKRQLIRAVSGRGYLLEADVSGPPDAADIPAKPLPDADAVAPETISEPAESRPGFRMSRRAALVAMGGGVSALAAATTLLPRFFAGSPATMAVIPMTTVSNDPETARMASGVIRELADGLAKIETIRVMTAPGVVQGADFVVNGDLEKTESAWNLRARLTESSTGTVRWTTALSVALAGDDMQLQQTRLVAGTGYPLALSINALLRSGNRSADGLPSGSAKAAIDQATAAINRTTLERYHAALAMLENALAADAGNVDLQVALAAFQLRGIQMAWFPAAEREPTEVRIGAIMEHALRTRPDYIPVLQTQCRFLSATNSFVESLVVCDRVLALDPWDGIALYLMGLAQVFLGRFNDALATFEQADRFDTPQVARWTWAIGVGWTCLLLDRPADALPWLQRSIAITPASGRTHMLLAAAYQQLGQTAEARAAMAKALELRPGSTARTAPPPTKNTSPVYLKATDRLISLMVAAGLPEN